MPRNIFPQIIKAGKYNVVIRHYKDKYREEVYELFKRSTKDSTGVGKGEFNSIGDLQKYLDKSYIKLTYHDVNKDDKIFGCLLGYPTPLSRSFAPICAAGYYILDADYRGIGGQKGGAEMTGNCALDAGCYKLLLRIASSAPNLVAGMKMGFNITATIPDSINVAKFGWVADFACYLDLESRFTHEEMSQFTNKLLKEPIIVENKRCISTLQPADQEVPMETVQINTNEDVLIKGATLEEVIMVEGMIKKCALNGEGFNLDEFCQIDGHFLHKFVHQPKVLVALSNENKVIGTAIYGFSTLPRMPGYLFAAYFVIGLSHRRKGIATMLLNTVEKIAREQNCNRLFFDVFINNYRAIEWLTKQGFITVGSLPYCGYITNKGFTDSVLMYKELSGK